MSSTVPPLPLPGPAGGPSATPPPGVAPLSAPDPRALAVDRLAQRIDALLPQTQCTRCGYPDCRAYADALAAGRAELNQCPPGGAEGVRRLAQLLGRPPLPVNPANGDEGPRRVVFIDEAACIGCTLCIQACPVDAIIGAPKRMHAVVEAACTGCELCLPVCPVDCIVLEDASAGATGWDAWSPAQADAARGRYAARAARLARDEREHAARLAARVAARQANAARAAGAARTGGIAAPALLADDIAGTVAPAEAVPPAGQRPLPPAILGAGGPRPGAADEATASQPSSVDTADASRVDPKSAAVAAALARARLRAKMRPT